MSLPLLALFFFFFFFLLLGKEENYSDFDVKLQMFLINLLMLIRGKVTSSHAELIAMAVKLERYGSHWIDLFH